MYIPKPLLELERHGKPVRIFEADERETYLRSLCGVIRRTTYTRWMLFYEEGRCYITHFGYSKVFGKYIVVESRPRKLWKAFRKNTFVL